MEKTLCVLLNLKDIYRGAYSIGWTAAEEHCKDKEKQDFIKKIINKEFESNAPYKTPIIEEDK